MCEADIGFPEGEIQIEILNQGETEFSVLNVKVLDITDDGDSCFTRRKLKFGIDFTTLMDKAIIRCKIKSYLFPDDKDIYSNNETVAIIPSKSLLEIKRVYKTKQHLKGFNLVVA